MPYRTFSHNDFYHVYNRGVDKRKIFLDDIDRDTFMSFMYECNNYFQSKKAEKLRKEIVCIHGFCLMDNHFHFLLQEVNDNGISKYMHKLSTMYSLYFNKRYKRSGALFQGRFKSKLIHSNSHFNYILDYIHLNPVMNYQRDTNLIIYDLILYKYSSFKDYIGLENYPDHFSRDFFLGYFGDYKGHFLETVKMKKEGTIEDELKEIEI